MNTMLGNQNLKNQILNFANDITKSGKTPQQLFDEIVASGKYTREQIESAKKKAEQFAFLFK